MNIEQFMQSKKTSVPIIKLDSLNLETSPALIKIDAEGFELNVLKGGGKFLEKFNYPPIMFEAWDLEWFKSDKAKLLKFLDYLGYEISLNIKSEFLAQHPDSWIRVDFISEANGVINMNRVR